MIGGRRVGLYIAITCEPLQVSPPSWGCRHPRPSAWGSAVDHPELPLLTGSMAVSEAGARTPAQAGL